MTNLADQYMLTGELGRLVRDAETDPDRVSMLTLGDKHHADASIVVIKGNAEVELFRQWAERNKLLERDSDFSGTPRSDDE